MSKTERNFRMALYWIGLIALVIAINHINIFAGLLIVLVYGVGMGFANCWAFPSLYEDVEDD
jgi:hypothetical protein